MSTKELAPTRTTWENACKKFLQVLLDGTQEFADSYVQHLDAGFTRSDLQPGIPQFTTDIWHRLERCGRGTLLPGFVWHTGSRELLKLNTESQETVLATGGLPVTSVDGSYRIVPIDTLSPDQVHQAVDPKTGTIRDSLAQQQARKQILELREEAAERLAERRQRQGWDIFMDGSCVINGVRFSRQQICRLFEDWQKVVLG